MVGRSVCRVRQNKRAKKSIASSWKKWCRRVCVISGKLSIRSLWLGERGSNELLPRFSKLFACVCVCVRAPVSIFDWNSRNWNANRRNARLRSVGRSKTLLLSSRFMRLSPQSGWVKKNASTVTTECTANGSFKLIASSPFYTFSAIRLVLCQSAVDLPPKISAWKSQAQSRWAWCSLISGGLIKTHGP